MSGSPYGNQTGGEPVGPYGNQLAGKPVGPYAVQGPLPANQNDRTNHRGVVHPVNVMAMQKFLRSQGYNIAADGVMGSQTRAAVADWHKGAGHRNPKGFAAPHANLLDRVKSTVVKAAQGTLAHTGGGAPAKHGKAGKGNGSSTVNLSGLAQIASGAGIPLPNSMADQLAGLQFDPQIHDLSTQRAQQPVQGAQDLHDIGSWYDQVLGSEDTARSRDAAASGAGVNSVRDAVAKIVASLGGSANAGAGLVGAAGADQVGSLQAQGTSQDEYNNDIRPLLREDAAGARARQIAQNEKNAQDIGAQLVDLVGQRGQAKGKAQMDISQYNNSLKQQGFQNKLAVEQAHEAALMSGLKVLDTQANIYKKTHPGAGKLPKGAFANTNATQKKALFDAIVNSVSENGQLRPGINSGRAARLVDAQIRASGWTRANPQVESYRNNILRALGLLH